MWYAIKYLSLPINDNIRKHAYCDDVAAYRRTQGHKTENAENHTENQFPLMRYLLPFQP